MNERRPYSRDLSDEQGALIAPVITVWKAEHRSVSGHTGRCEMREIANALLFQNRTGCQWDYLPHDLLPRGAVHYCFLGTRLDSLRFVLRDRDTKYTDSFDAVFKAEETDVLLSAPQAPRMSAHCERVIGTVRREALDHVLIMNEAHARQVLAEYRNHYNRHRPHRSRDQRPPEAQEQPAVPHQLEPRRLLRTRVLGGVINDYRYAA